MPAEPSGQFRCWFLTCLLAVLVGPMGLVPLTHAQVTDNPVFPDESPLARDGLSSVPGLIAAANWPEAIRTLQEALDQNAERVLPALTAEELASGPAGGARPAAPNARGSGVYVTVRQIVHQRLLANPELLDRYRRTVEPAAAQALERGEHATVERSYFLTTAGFEATLRVAEEHLRHARFETARLVLEQLQTHPDRTAARSVRAGEVLERVAAYLDRPSVIAQAQSWQLAGVQRQGEQGDNDQHAVTPAQWPAAARARVYEPSLPAGDLDPALVTTAPLRSVELAEGAMISRPARANSIADRPVSWMFPLAVGDRVFVNEGWRIAAYDRYSLDLLWRTELPDPVKNERELAIDPRIGTNEPTSLSWAPGLVLTVTGLATDSGERGGNERLHAIDAATGAVRWSVLPSDLDSRLTGAIFKGPALIEGDLAIMVVRRADVTLRSLSVALVGIRLSDGTAAWLRPLVSAGSVGFSREIAAADWPTLHQGVVYLADRIGAIVAVEAGTGRVRWVRLDPTPPRRSSTRSMTWAVQRPVISDDAIALLSSDRQRVLWVRQSDGALLAAMGVPMMGDLAQCIVRVDPATLAIVNVDRVALIPSDAGAIAAGRVPAQVTGPLDAVSLVGRPMAVGGRLYAPTSNGVVVIDPKEPRRGDRIAIDQMGTLLALDSQLLVTGAADMHSYLVWDVAASVLRARLAQEPTNPDPAITLAELAYRSGRFDQIREPLDQAMQIVSTQNDHPAKGRLYTAVRTIIESGAREWLFDASAATGNEGPKFASIQQALPLLVLLEGVSVSPAQRVGYELLSGRLAEERGAYARAAESYQRVLTTPELAGALWSSRELTIGAGREATRRLQSMLTQHGPQIYAAFEKAAADELASRDGRSDPGAVALRYPIARVAPRAWLQAAQLRAQNDDASGELAALESGVRTALLRQLASPDEPVTPVSQPDATDGTTPRDAPATTPVGSADQALLGELGGLAITRLMEAGRLAAARALLEETAALPGLVLTANNTPIDVRGLLIEVGERLGLRGRLPLVGRTIGTEYQAWEGWRLAPPIAEDIARRSDTMVTMVDDRRSVLGLFELHAGGEKLLERRWERPFNVSPIVVRMDEQRVLVYLEEDEGRIFESIDATSGRTVWRVGPVNTIAAAAQDPRLARGNASGINTALDGWRPADDLVIALDTQTLVLVQRSGAAFATSLDDGALLWRTQLPLDRVVDIDVADGVLCIVGDQAVQPRRAVPRLLVFDARTGETLHQLGDEGNFYRWVKLTDQGVVLAGLEAGIVAMRARTGEELWSAREPIMAGTFGAWVFDDRVLTLGQGGDLLVGDVATGRFTGPLAGRDDRQESGQLAAWRDENRLIVASELGVRIYQVDGRPIATDALDGSSRLVMPTPGVGVALMAEQLAVRNMSSPRAGFKVRLLDTATGRLLDTKRLEMPEAPQTAALLDGVMLLSTPGMTVVMPLGTK